MPTITSSSSTSFEFIKEDVQNQRKIAEDLLNKVEQIQSLLDENPDFPDKEKFEELRDSLVLSARDLASNANTTSLAATTVISEVTAKST